MNPAVLPCMALWSTAVIASDGGVAPCTGTFYAADDMGRLEEKMLGHSSFRSVWNNERYQTARRFFRAREGTAREREQVCFDCPATTEWERARLHRAAGGGVPFVPGITTNDAWNYFWSRRPSNALRLHADGETGGARARARGAGADR